MKKRVIVFVSMLFAAFFVMSGVTAYAATFFTGPKYNASFSNTVSGSSATLASHESYARLTAKSGYEPNYKYIEAKTYICTSGSTTKLDEYSESRGGLPSYLDLTYDTGDANNLVVYGQIYNSDVSYTGVNNELLLVTRRSKTTTELDREYYDIYL